MRSTSVTPPPDDPAPPAAAMDEDNDEIVFISDNMRTPAKNKAGPSAPSGATPSPTKKRRVAKMEDDDTVETPKKRGKKRARTEEDELTDEGLVSDELKVAAGVKDEKKVVGSSTSPGRGSPAKKREIRKFTLEEDKLIIQQIMDNFDSLPIQKATSRTQPTVMYRFRTLLKTALRGTHGDEHAVLPGGA